MSLFGNTNKPAAGLFGTTQPAQSTGFGGTTANANAGTTPLQITPPSGFGSLVPQQQQQQPQQPQGGLFGSGQSQPTQGGGLFGGGGGSGTASGDSNAGSGTFGNTSAAAGGNAGGGLFGNTGTSTGGTTGGTSGGLFGNTGGGTSGGLFGATVTGGNAAGTSGGQFGNANTTVTGGTGTGGGLSGSGNPNTSTAASGGLFGSTSNATPGTSSIFGQPSDSSPSGLFGQSQPQQQPQQQGTSSLFSSFGQNQTQSQTQPGLAFNLGQPSTNTGGGSGLFSSTSQNQSPFGSLKPFPQPTSTGSLFGPKPPLPSLSLSSFLPTGQSHQSDNSAQAQSAAVQQRIEAVFAAWNPQSPHCRFQHYFYNLVDPAQVNMYGRPSNATNDALWQRAVRENPDPSCMVPVLAVGFGDLHKRVEAQSKQAALHQEKLKELQARLSTLSQTHLLSNTLRSTRALQTHALITYRMLRLIEHLHLLIPSLRSSAISPEEEALRAKLERLKDDIQRSLGSGGGRGRVNELWALLGAVKAAKERDVGGGRDGVEWKVVDQEGLERLALVLAEQQQGLAHLTSIINNDTRDLQIVGGRGSLADGSSAHHSGGLPSLHGTTASGPGPLPGR